MWKKVRFTLPFLLLGICLASCSGSTVQTAGAAASPTQAQAGEKPNCLARDFAPGPVGSKLEVPYRSQHRGRWVWASTLTMVASHYGWTMNECQLVTAKSGARCCRFDGSESGCDGGIDADEVADFMAQVLHIQGKRVIGTITERELQTELASGRPVLIGFDGPFDGNFAVVSGFTPGKTALYHVQGPSDQVGDSMRPYADIVFDKATGAHWDQTWSRLMPPEQYCRKLTDADIARDPGF